MAEEISREQQKDIVRQRQIEIAKSMKVKPDILDILNKVEEWQNREWLYICALDGMPTEQIRTLQESKATTGQIRKARMDHLQNICVKTDLFQKNVESLQKEVREVCRESREARNAIENGLEEAMKKQAQAQEETILAKDQVIAMLHVQVEDLKRQLKECREMVGSYSLTDETNIEQPVLKKVRDIEQPLSVPEVSDPPRGDAERNESASRKEREYLRQKNSGNRFIKAIMGTRKDTDIRRFIEKYIKDDKLSDEQKDFLLDCLEEGIEIKDIEKFAAPGLPVKVMQRLKRLQIKE